MKIQILTSKNSWLNSNKKFFIKRKGIWKNVKIINNHKRIKKNTDITAILSYYNIIPEKFFKYSKHNLVVHESDLPKGRGFSPLYWQIINGANKITFSLFECSKKMDQGKIYIKRKFTFPLSFTYDEIKRKQLASALKLIETFIKNFKKNKIRSSIQKGKATYYKKIPKNLSKININKSIISQINIIRTRDNQKFPSYFFYKKRKYYLKLFTE